jgi:crotonobetainyl-CoA:carnitine CoA-transferase CaiB-like acyl-CoA transferase
MDEPERREDHHRAGDAAGPAPIRPLDGVRVVDVTHVLAGPYCAYQLALLGADVIKVEPLTGDLVRPWKGSRDQMRAGMGTGFMAQNAGKRSLCVDLTDPDGRDIVLALAERAEVFLENYRPGALAGHRLGYDDVRRVNDRIVYASISAFGQNGPHGHRPGFDDVVQGTSGFMATNKRDDGPIRTGGPVLDYASGMHATAAILAAMLLRDRTGESQRVDLAMQDVTMLLVNYETAAASQHGGTSPPKSNVDGPMLGRFATADGHVMLAGYLPRHCQSIAAVLGLDEYLDVGFRDLAERGPEIQAAVEARLRTKTSAAWDAIFDEAGVVGGAVRELTETFASGQPGARGLTEPLETPVGEIHVTTNGYRINDQTWGPRSSVPLLGEHSRSVLAELGLDDGRIDELVDRGVVVEPADRGAGRA